MFKSFSNLFKISVYENRFNVLCNFRRDAYFIWSKCMMRWCVQKSIGWRHSVTCVVVIQALRLCRATCSPSQCQLQSRQRRRLVVAAHSDDCLDLDRVCEVLCLLLLLLLLSLLSSFYWSWLHTFHLLSYMHTYVCVLLVTVVTDSFANYKLYVPVT